KCYQTGRTKSPTQSRGRCPLWVKSGHRSRSASCPVLSPKADIGTKPRGASPSLGERGNGGLRDLLAPLLNPVTTIWNLERRGTPAFLPAQCCHHRRSQYRVFHPDGHERLPAPLMRRPP